MTEPLLRVEDLRVDIDGVPTCDGLTMRTAGERVLVLGGPRALYEATCGLRPVVRGVLRIRGSAPDAAVRDGIVAGAPLDPPLPPKWSVLDYVMWSARLAGHTAGDARTLAKEAIALVQLDAMSGSTMERIAPHARRGVVLAAALATDAAVIALDDPLASLPEEIARSWARIIVQALGDRAWIVFASRISLTSPLAMNADDALMISSSRLDAQGAPAEIAAADRRFVARIHSAHPLDALGAKLSERGARMDIQGAQVLLDLGASVTTADLLAMCAELEATVVEMVPVARPLT
ncbi:MAG: transporter related protein [Labilithrix sp.]|nr:transporter related protein [Labilithrix sp.]